ncbi:MAG: hypothetical protein M3501_00705 [Actinomycetota bacterium]|nr:hypothetical protein [Actinomycetota bacterium]
MATPHRGLATLVEAAQDGVLDALVEQAALDLVVVFGSVVGQSVAEPGDLDIAVRFIDRASSDLVGVTDALPSAHRP